MEAEERRAQEELERARAEAGEGGDGGADEGGEDEASAEAERRARATAAKIEADALPEIMAAMFMVTKLDIEGTLRAVCSRVLRDAEQPKEVWRGRAEGLRLLGVIFRAVGAEAAKNAPDQGAKERMQSAMEAAMRQQQGQDA